MARTSILLSAIAVLTLGGCVNPHNEAMKNCTQAGLTVGTPEFGACYQANLAQATANNATKAAAFGAALGAASDIYAARHN